MPFIPEKSNPVAISQEIHFASLIYSDAHHHNLKSKSFSQSVREVMEVGTEDKSKSKVVAPQHRWT